MKSSAKKPNKKDLQRARSLGLRLFPLDVVKKKPAITGWAEAATNNIETLKKWTKKFGLNFGVACGPSGIVVIDEDGPAGRDSLLGLLLEHGELPPTLEARTQSGNRHLYFKGKCTSKNRILPGLDVKSVGGLVACPGSAGYSWLNDHPMAPIPDWFVQIVGKARDKSEKVVGVVSKDEDADVVRAIKYLSKVAPPSIEGEGGDSNCFKVACRIVDFGLSEDKCLELMLDHWNDRCEPPWSPEELVRKVQNAYSYRGEDIGKDSTAGDFEEDDDGDVDKQIENFAGVKPRSVSLMEELNARFHACSENGKFVIFKEDIDIFTGYPTWTRMGILDFKNYFGNRFVTVGEKNKPVGEWWVTHKERMQHPQVYFDPAKPPGGECNKPLNLWRGLAIKPAHGDWSIMRDEVIFKALCNSDGQSFEYVMNWLAYLFQKPERQAEVALVFKGIRGAGKSTLGHAVQKICGPHGMTISQPEQLVGQFTGHLYEKIFVLAEEALWAGNKRHEARLKSMITDSVLTYEAKFVNAFTGPNRLSLIMVSNEDWVVPASMEGERRFAVFEVSDCRVGDFKFWDEVHEVMNNGGLAAMLDELLQRKIGRWHPRKDIPSTQALTDQKMVGMSYEEHWWYDLLDRGEVDPEWLLRGRVCWSEEIIVDKDMLHTDYLFHVRENGCRHPKNKNYLGIWLKKRGVQPRQVRLKDGTRTWGWSVPSLWKARLDLASKLKFDPWEQDMFS